MSTYDFIVVGAGPAGAACAWTLARAKSNPSVLLLEAGGHSLSLDDRVDFDKFTSLANPSLNWGYKTEPIDSIDGRRIDYDRGKGLGGSTSINFTVFTYGPREDWDFVAKSLGDPAWGWDRCTKRWEALISYDPVDAPDRAEKFVETTSKGSGPLKITHSFDSLQMDMANAWSANGYPLCRDMNSGNPIGPAMSPLTAHKGTRSTAADLLNDAPSNLTVISNANVARVRFDGHKKATGVETTDGRIFEALKEIVVSCGALDTPRVLLHSGIGPSSQLRQFNIPLVKELPIGQGLKDHYHTVAHWSLENYESELREFFRDPPRQAKAREEFKQQGTGDLLRLGRGLMIAFLKSDAIASSHEYAALPAEEKARLEGPGNAHYEMGVPSQTGQYYENPTTSPVLVPVHAFVMNSQGVGETVLQSSDPSVPLAFKPSVLEHPYDKRVAIEALREVMAVMSSDVMATFGPKPYDTPKSTSDEDILEWWKRTVASTWHMLGTAKMGVVDDGECCVDNDLKVFGVKGLRVADMSVFPILPNCHTQSTAYQIGLTAGEKMVEDHDL